MTKPLHDQPLAAYDGAFYSNYSDLYDTGSMDYGAAAVEAGQNHPDVSASSESDMPYALGWDYGTIDAQMWYPFHSPETFPGEEHVLQPQPQWNYGAQAYPAQIDNTVAGGALGMADSMSHHAPAMDSTNGRYDSLKWPYQPPMGQISPSPSQSSHYASSSASGAGAHYSRHNSCSSLPAARVAALEQTRFDARFQPVPDQALSPDDGRVTPGGLQTGADLYARQTMHPWDHPQSQKPTMSTTTDHDAGTVSPAMTPSPRNAITAISSQPATQSARNTRDQRTSKTDKRKENSLLPARQTTKQKQSEEGGRFQSHQHQPEQEQEQHSQLGKHAKGQVAANPTQPMVRHRNRDAANKCRAKTKQAMSDLESTERAMGSEHRELSEVARGLRDEVLMLKNELLAHGTCDDALIQQYLTNQARRVGYGTAHPPQRQQQHQPEQRQQRHQGPRHK